MDYPFFSTYYSILLFLKVLPILFTLPIILFFAPIILKNNTKSEPKLVRKKPFMVIHHEETYERLLYSNMELCQQLFGRR